uniref:Ras association domain family member 10 n=1 Tax=Salvator merianae TaxID=96440 RepID=A0A8D0AY42_SALMN
TISYSPQRSRSRRRIPMEPEEKKISVWICQEEKLISGLSKRTTCSDVQQLASLQECGGGMLSGPPHSYCIVEKWRGFERILPNKTKILRLWAAWGDEQENVRFVLVRSEASLPNTGPRSAEARVVPSKESPCQHGLGAAAARASLVLSQERQRRVVRKAFRKLAKINKRKGGPGGPPPHDEEPPAGRDHREASSSAERMETLVHLVLSQDHTIRQQLKRLRELDRDIDRFEAKIHFDRMKRHGVNYVQDTYLVGGEAEPPAAEPPAGEGDATADGAAWAEYACKCEQVLLLQDQWRRQEELVEQLAGEIQQELNDLSSETDCNTTELGGGGGGELHVEQERVRTQLSTSLYIGLRLSTDLEAVKMDLEAVQRTWADKETELERLLGALQALDVEEDEEDDGPPPPLQLPDGGDELSEPAPLTSEGWGEPAARSLEKDCEENDEDSDTGLSSMHSQDSDSVPVSIPYFFLGGGVLLLS